MPIGRFNALNLGDDDDPEARTTTTTTPATTISRQWCWHSCVRQPAMQLSVAYSLLKATLAGKAIPGT